MRERFRAFTFVEIIIVLPLMAILGSALLICFVSVTREYSAAVLQGDLKVESRRAVSSLFSRAARGPWKIHPDQRGLTFADGSQARWDGEHLTLQGKSLLPHRVNSFLAFRREDRLVVNLEVEAPGRLQGPPLRQHFIYDFPSVKDGQ